jgi:hypothetical protein
MSTFTATKATKKLSFSQKLHQLFGTDASTQNSETIWLKVLEGIEGDTEEGAQEFRQVIRSFLMPDKISFPKFRANWIALFGLRIDPDRGLPSWSADDLSLDPTPSVQKLSLASSRPVGHPDWFLAAYPDVASWFRSLADAIVESPEAEDFYQNMLFGKIDESGFLDDNRRIKGKYLRIMIDTYRRETGRALECQ